MPNARADMDQAPRPSSAASARDHDDSDLHAPPPAPPAEEEHADVAVLGASVTGLATTLAMLQADPTLSVLDARPATQGKPGGAVHLAPNGVKAAAATSADLHASLMASAVVARQALVHDTDSSIIARSQAGAARREAAAHGAPTVVLGWSKLEAALLALLPPGVVRYGTYLARYAESSEDVSLELREGPAVPAPPEEGTVTPAERPTKAAAAAARADAPAGSDTSGGEQPAAPAAAAGPGTHVLRAKLLLACDGPFSHVRERCMADGPPTFDGTLRWTGRLPGDFCASLPSACEAWWIHPGLAFVSHPLRLAHAPALAECGMRYEPASRAVAREDGRPATTAEVLRRLFSGFPTPVLHMLDHTEADTVLAAPVYVRSPAAMPPCLGKGQVVVLGEAAHPLRPTGQEESLALEDAAEMGAALQRYGPSKEALRQFELRRRPRWRHGMMVTMAQGAACHVPLGVRPGLADFQADLFDATFEPLGRRPAPQVQGGGKGGFWRRLLRRGPGRRASLAQLAAPGRVVAGRADSPTSSLVSEEPPAHLEGDEEGAWAQADMHAARLCRPAPKRPPQRGRRGAGHGLLTAALRLAGGTLVAYSFALAGAPALCTLRRKHQAGDFADRGGLVGAALSGLASLPAVLPLPEAHGGAGVDGDAADDQVHGRVPGVTPGPVQRVAQAVGGKALEAGAAASAPVVHVVQHRLGSRIAQALGAF